MSVVNCPLHTSCTRNVLQGKVRRALGMFDLRFTTKNPGGRDPMVAIFLSMLQVVGVGNGLGGATAWVRGRSANCGQTRTHTPLVFEPKASLRYVSGDRDHQSRHSVRESNLDVKLLMLLF